MFILSRISDSLFYCIPVILSSAQVCLHFLEHLWLQCRTVSLDCAQCKCTCNIHDISCKQISSRSFSVATPSATCQKSMNIGWKQEYTSVNWYSSIARVECKGYTFALKEIMKAIDMNSFIVLYIYSEVCYIKQSHIHCMFRQCHKVHTTLTQVLFCSHAFQQRSLEEFKFAIWFK